MKKRKKTLIACLVLVSVLVPIHVFGEEGHKPSKSEDKDTHSEMTQDRHSTGDPASLQEQLEMLEKRLKRLEALVPSFTGFMPEFSERFHVLHAAGDVGDWALANHEVQELLRLMRLSKAIDPEKGTLMEAFLGQSLLGIEAAVEHGSNKAFSKALAQTVENCNACHKAAGSPFIKVSLEIPHDMSMRHAHILAKSKVGKMKHTH